MTNGRTHARQDGRRISAHGHGALTTRRCSRSCAKCAAGGKCGLKRRREYEKQKRRRRIPPLRFTHRQVALIGMLCDFHLALKSERGRNARLAGSARFYLSSKTSNQKLTMPTTYRRCDQTVS